MKKIILSLVFLGSFCSLVSAQHKINYSLFKPVPTDSLREIETDRPDVTESPRTVDAGHFQLETDLFRLERRNTKQGRTDDYLFNQMNIKVGLTRSTAMQVNFETYSVKLDFEGGVKQDHSSGFGDVTLRLKQNLIGNDKGRFAVALLPYLKFPTSHADSESQYEGGIIVPMSIKFDNDWKLGVQLEADRLQDEEGAGHHNEVLQTLTVSHPLSTKIDAILETYYTCELKTAHFKNFINAALQYELGKNLLIDGGVNYGMQHEAKKSCFVGLSFRL